MNIQGRRQYLWRAVDQDGDLIDILVQSRRDRQAAARFFRKLLKGQGRGPRRLITDKLLSYRAAHRTVMPSVVHSTRQYENNRAEVSHQPTRQRERQMRRFKSVGTRAALLVGARARAESLSCGAPPAPSGASPITENAIVLRLECGDVCLLSNDGHQDNEGSLRLFLVNLTVPTRVIEGSLRPLLVKLRPLLVNLTVPNSGLFRPMLAPTRSRGDNRSTARRHAGVRIAQRLGESHVGRPGGSDPIRNPIGDRAATGRLSFRTLRGADPGGQNGNPG